MSYDSQDETIRILKKTSFDKVYDAMEKYSSGRGSSGTNVLQVKNILEEHGWTTTEFVDGLILQMKKLDG